MMRGSVGDYDGPDAPWNQPDAETAEAYIITGIFVPLPRFTHGWDMESVWLYVDHMLKDTVGMSLGELQSEFGGIYDQDRYSNVFWAEFVRDSYVYGVSEMDRDEDGPYRVGFEVDDDDFMYRDLSDGLHEKMMRLVKAGG